MFSYVRLVNLKHVGHASSGRRIALFIRSISLLTTKYGMQPVRRGKGRLGLPALPESYRHYHVQ